jgi:hypothetical protein
MKNIFPESTPCCSSKYPECDEYGALCPADERALRRYMAGDPMPKMTEEQRKTLLEEINYCSEGLYSPDDSESCSDKELAWYALLAWRQYVRDKFGDWR